MTDSAECVDCPSHDGVHGIGHRRAAEGPPPLAAEMSPDPEPAGPSYFHPLPTRPVFGPRSEQPDAIEGQSLLPVPAPSHDAEPMIPLLPPPSSDEPEKTDDGPLEQEPDDGGPGADSSTGLRRLPDSREAQAAGWKAAKKQVARKRTVRSTVSGKKVTATETAKATGSKQSRPCPHCSVSFKPRPSNDAD
ncbi:MAG TPA: hypothetical protein VF306_13960 [Pirellulales bacterium]